MLRVAAIQMKMGPDRSLNVARAIVAVREAAAAGAKLIVLPELFESQYFPQTEVETVFEWAQELAQRGGLVETFKNLAQELKVLLPLSVFEREANSYYNSLVMIDDHGDIAQVYRKAHIPDGPSYEEKFYFAPGNTPFKPWVTPAASIGCGICWDQWFPECARALVIQGAELLLYPTAIGSEPPEAGAIDTRGMWRSAMVGHAVCNAVPVIAANRIGLEGNMTFYGHSFICDPTGTLVASADNQQETTLYADLDLNHWRRHRAAMGFFRDRRPELYGSLLTREGRTVQ
jgi:N-carbamoylputrescine amidase